MSTSVRLNRGLDKLGLSKHDDLSERLLAFVDDLIKWNKVYNLTSIRNPDEIVTQHLLDSLSIHPHLTTGSLVDVGAGGGFPGIPLAMCFPDMPISLLDSNVKKTRFLQQAVINHKLKNCNVIHSRAESCDLAFDQVVCRAFASLANIVQFAGHLVSDNGRLLAMKGKLIEELEEFEQADNGFRIIDMIQLEVPSLDAQRYLVAMERC